MWRLCCMCDKEFPANEGYQGRRRVRPGGGWSNTFICDDCADHVSKLVDEFTERELRDAYDREQKAKDRPPGEGKAKVLPLRHPTGQGSA